MFDLSIIVPIYKSEKYLEKCLDSIYTIDRNKINYQVILVVYKNDISTEKSHSIALEYYKKFEDLTLLVEHKMIGAAAARNIGLDCATGQYIHFIDSDDFIDPKNLSNCLKLAQENNLDLLTFDFTRVDSEGVAQKKNKQQKKDTLYKKELWNGKGLPEVTPWSHLYKKSFLEKYNLNFYNGRIAYEDFLFNMKVFCHVKNYLSVNTPVYYYRDTPGSLSNTPKISDVKDVKYIIQDLLVFSFLSQLEKSKKFYFYKHISNLLNLTFDRNKIIIKQMIKDFLTIEDCPLFLKLRLLFKIHKLKNLKYLTVNDFDDIKAKL